MAEAEKKETIPRAMARRQDIPSMHDDLKSALKHFAGADRRTTSQFLEIILLDYVRSKLKNPFENYGSLTPGEPRGFVQKKTK